MERLECLCCERRSYCKREVNELILGEIKEKDKCPYALVSNPSERKIEKKEGNLEEWRRKCT